jgi:hypothetical protein
MPPPASLARALATYVANASQDATLVSALADARGAGDTGALVTDVHKQRQFARDGDRALAGKGFTRCGRRR